jgi:AraC-like DNA-binding protein
MNFQKLQLREAIVIRKLISFHYFEYAKGYVFEGEQHDFWEFLYVDKGEVQVQADDRLYHLKQGHIIFHKPNEFHTVRVCHDHKPPNLIVIAFDCFSHSICALENKVIMLCDQERNLLTHVLREGFNAFVPPFDTSYEHTITRNPLAPFAAEQLVKMNLEALLIHINRNLQPTSKLPSSPLSAAHKEKNDHERVAQIIEYLQNHMTQSLSLEELCKVFHLGKSRLKELFQSQTGMGLLEYHKNLKIEHAKTLIREKKYNMTEIAELLGYTSIHYFSRDFKKRTDMSPTEYAKTVSARL